MAFSSQANVPEYPISVKSSPTYGFDRSLTPPKSSASSRTASTTDTSHDTSIRTPLVVLAEEIATYARILSDFYISSALPQPSFDLDGPDDYSNHLPDDIQEARAKLRSATADMQMLAAGPKENIMWMTWGYHDVSLLHYVSHFKIAEAVPLNGTIAIEKVCLSVLYLVGARQLTPHLACICHGNFSNPFEEDNALSHSASCFCGAKPWTGRPYALEQTARNV
jgi:hypothetical protein